MNITFLTGIAYSLVYGILISFDYIKKSPRAFVILGVLTTQMALLLAFGYHVWILQLDLLIPVVQFLAAWVVYLKCLRVQDGSMAKVKEENIR